MTKIAVTIRRYSEKIATMRNFGTIQENVCLGAHTKQECSRKRKILFKQGTNITNALNLLFFFLYGRRKE